MFDTNLSKIKPQLRTKGAVTGNFGHAKSKAGSPLREIGETKRETVRVTSRSEYVKRMIEVWRTAPNADLRQFAYLELHRLNCFEEQRIVPTRTAEPFKGHS